MQIREMTPSDWPDVCRIYVDGMNTDLATFETAPPDWTNWDAGHISKPRLIAEDEGKIIGFAVLSPASKRACYAGVAEVSVYVDPAVKAKGIGRALMRTLIERAEQAGFWTLQSSIFPENVASIRLHEAMGFRRVGYRERIAQRLGRWRDTVLYERRAVG